MVVTGLVALGISIFTFHLIFPMHILLGSIAGAHTGPLSLIWTYFADFGWSVVHLQYPDFISYYYGQWIDQAAVQSSKPTPLIVFAGEGLYRTVTFDLGPAPMIWLSFPILTLIIGALLNTHNRTPNIYGDARWATMDEVKQMQERNLIGFDGKLVVVGKLDGKFLLLKETMSVLLLAPPGCQPEGSDVHMADGTVKGAESVAIDDLVLSPTDDGEMVPARVKRVFHEADRPLYEVRAASGASYRCSDNHIVTAAAMDLTSIKTVDLPLATLLSDRALTQSLRLPIDDGGTWRYEPFSIEPAGRGPVHGFELEGVSQRYLTDGRIATHNTGKSIGFIVPSIQRMDQACMIIHDVKPELFIMCSNHRAKVGPTFQLAWAASDYPNGRELRPDEVKEFPPEMLERDEATGQPVRTARGRYKSKPIYYPSWNPLSPKCVPPVGPSRDLYITRLWTGIVPEPKSGDPFWARMARNGGIGLSHYLVAKVEAAMEAKARGEDDEPFWRGIPAHFRGMEASFPMLVDWFAEAQQAIPSGPNAGEDPMKSLFEEAIKDIKANGYPHRALVELTQLMNQNEKTRSGILTSFDDAISIFKIEAVKQRTSSCDFSFSDLRGMPSAAAVAREQAKLAQDPAYEPTYDQQTDYQPVTVFISINQQDAQALAVITSIFVDAANSYLIAQTPGSYDDKGNQLGPFDFVFMLDEMPQLKKLDAVVNGPSVGRGQRVSYFLVGQDYGQIELIYSKPEVEILNSNTAVKIILSQNNATTAKQISEMIGKHTFEKESLSEKAPQNVKDNPFAALGTSKSKSHSYEGTEFVKASFIAAMPKGKHLVLVQNFINRPLLCDTPKFFEDETLSAITFNRIKKTGPQPAPPMSLDLMAAAAARRALESAARRDSQDIDRTFYIMTPADIQSLSRDANGELPEKGPTFALYELRGDEPDYGDLPGSADAIRSTDDIKEVVQVIGRGKFIVFSRDILGAEINSRLQDLGMRPLSAEKAYFLSERAEEIGEEPATDIFSMGVQGGPALDQPPAGMRIDPLYAIGWCARIYSFIRGVEDSRRNYEADF